MQSFSSAVITSSFVLWGDMTPDDGDNVNTLPSFICKWYNGGGIVVQW